jgi:hypothetical protein
MTLEDLRQALTERHPEIDSKEREEALARVLTLLEDEGLLEQSS